MVRKFFSWFFIGIMGFFIPFFSSPVMACISPISELITTIIPEPGAIDVPTNISVTLRYRNVDMRIDNGSNTYGNMIYNLSLTKKATKEIVAGNIISTGNVWYGAAELRFVPQNPLEPKTEYIINELPGSYNSKDSYSFTTGDKPDNSTYVFDDEIIGSLKESTQEDYAICMGQPGMCPNELHSGWLYPVFVQLTIKPLQHLYYSWPGFRYVVFSIDTLGSEKEVYAFETKEVTGDSATVSFQIASGEYDMSSPEYCYRMEAHDVYGKVYSNTQKICFKKEALIKAKREDPISVADWTCNKETGAWEKKSSDGGTEIVANDVGTESDAGPVVSAHNSSGCSISSDGSGPTKGVLALILWLGWVVIRRNRKLTD